MFVWIRGRLRALGLDWFKVNTYMGLFGGETLKPHVLYGNESLLAHLRRDDPQSFKPTEKNPFAKCTRTRADAQQFAVDQR